MSVRNQYARNYSKVTPFPPSSQLISEAKMATRRANYSRPPSDKTVRTNIDLYSSVKREKTRELIGKDELAAIAKTAENKHSSKNGNERVQEIVESKTFTELGPSHKETRNTTNGCEILRVWEDEEDRADQSNLEKVDSEQSTIKMHRADDKNSKASRPKSARPESRRERRTVEQFFDTSEIVQHKPMRPKSARPESRMLRFMEARAQSEFEKDNLPPRPRTSYGRRRSTGTEHDLDITVLERPKSRIGNHTHERGERDSKPKKRGDKQKCFKQDRTQNATQMWQQENELQSHSPPGNFTTWRSKTVLDLNSGIDDIDLDVDPVLYFMQEDDLPQTGVMTSQPLSKDTIEFIGNTGNQRPNKATISYHGNYLDKHVTTAVNPNRFCGNRVNSVPNSIPDKNFPLQKEKHTVRKGGQSVTDSLRSPFSGDIPYRDSKADSHKYLKLNRPKEMMNERRVQHGADYFQNGRYARNSEGSGQNQPSLSYRRHPRRLQPIIATLNDNT